MAQTCGNVGIVQVAREPTCFWIQSIQTTICADPEHARAVLVYGSDDVVADAVWVVGIVSVMREPLRNRIVTVQTPVKGADPQSSGSILKN